MRKQRSLTTKLLINGKMVGVLTVTGFARVIGKSSLTVRRYEKLGVFPQAPITKGNARYYPITLANKLVEVVSRIPVNRKPDADLIVEINKLFKEERDLLCQE